jgi:hypothetical protein
MSSRPDGREELEAGCYCDQCNCWHPLKGDNGECRRRAPSTQGFPAAKDSDWCGEGQTDEDSPHLKNWPEKCSNCIHYKWINDNYGHCYALPPDAEFEFQKVRADRIACRFGVSL